MKRPALSLAALAIALSCAGQAQAATLCVDHQRHGCFRGLQGAVDAAHGGDTIRLAPGTYRGGVRIELSVDLRGAGADRTRIHGGGPVLTLAGSPATVIAISGVTVSGGITRETDAPQFALGGGIFIPGSGDEDLGATVTIDRSKIADNLASPTVAVTPGLNEGCPECPFAIAFGGGIYNAGNLTLTRTTVAHNRVAGPVTSVPEGGGIYSPGPLTLDRSRVLANDAISRPPNGRGSAAGGLWAKENGLIVRRTTIARNRSITISSLPIGERVGAIAGGVLVQCTADLAGCDLQRHEGVEATIEHSRIRGNEASAFNPVGDAIAFSAGVHGNGAVSIRDSVVDENRARAMTPAPGATADADSVAGNLNVGGDIDRTRFIGNSGFAHAPAGTAFAGAGSLLAWADDPIDVRDSMFAGNRLTAVGETVDAFGAGLVNVDALTLHGVRVSGNTLRASGASGTAAGGGVFNGVRPESEGFTPVFSAFDSFITGNAIIASPGIGVQGGGLFTNHPATLERVLVRGNRPDDLVSTPAERAYAERRARAAHRVSGVGGR
jgi:hypothetical protein